MTRHLFLPAVILAGLSGTASAATVTLTDTWQVVATGPTLISVQNGDGLFEASSTAPTDNGLPVFRNQQPLAFAAPAGVSIWGKRRAPARSNTGAPLSTIVTTTTITVGVAGSSANQYPGNDYARDGTDATAATAPSGATGIRGWLSGIYQAVTGTLKINNAQVGGTNVSTGSGAIDAGTQRVTDPNNASYTSAGTATASGTLPNPGTMPPGGAPRGFAYSCDGTTGIGQKTTITFSGGGTMPVAVAANTAAREGLSATAATAVAGCTFQALY